MPKRHIVRMAESDGSTWVDYFSEYETIVDENPILGIEELADMCDQNAESRNNHGAVGMHRILAALLYDMVGQYYTNVVMREIAEYGGMDGMNGNGGEQDAFADFGIKQPFHEWELPDKVV